MKDRTIQQVRHPRKSIRVSVAFVMVSLCAPCYGADTNTELVPGHQITPTQPTASIYLEQIDQKLMSGDYMSARSIAQYGVEANPESAILWLRLGVCYQTMDEFKMSISAYQKAYSLDPKGQRETFFFIASVYEKLHEDKLAYDNYVQYFRLDSGGRYALAAKARIREYESLTAPASEMQLRNLIRLSENKQIPGPKIYKLQQSKTMSDMHNSASNSPTVLLNVSANGSAELMPAADAISFKDCTLNDLFHFWGPEVQRTFRTDFGSGQRVQELASNERQYFMETKEAVYAIFTLFTDKLSLARIEAFFERPTLIADTGTAKLVKYRVILIGIGATSWIEAKTADGTK